MGVVGQLPNRRIIVSKVDGGLNLSAPELINEDQCQACENVDFSSIVGRLVTRKGTAKLNTATLAVGTNSNIYANFKLYNSGNNNYRYTHAGTSHFRNFVSYKTSISTKPVKAVGFRDQAFFSDGTSLWSDDGTSTNGYSWGITAPGSAVSVSTGAVPSTVVAHFDNSGTNSEAWGAVEGTQTFDTATYKEGAESLSILCSTSSYLGISTLVLSTAIDLSTNAGGTTAGQAYFTMWAYVADATKLDSITVEFDVNDGSFQSDYYSDTVDALTTVTSAPTYLQGDPSQAAYFYDYFGTSPPSFVQPTVKTIQKIGNGWSKLLLSQTDFNRVGAASGKDWSTVKAIKVQFNGNAQTTVKFDDLEIIGNTLTLGTAVYYWYETFQHRDSGGNLLDESNASPVSAGLSAAGGSVVVTTTNTTTTSFVNYRGFYRIGGNLPQPYMVGTATYTGGTSTFTDTLSDLNALYTNIPLATDNDAPVAGNYFLEGPHYDRIFMGTGTKIAWTKVNQPHSAPTTNTAPIPGGQAGDTIQAIRKYARRIYVYTYTTVYELSGSAEDTFDFHKTYSRTGTPAGNTVVDAGDRMIYLGGVGTLPSGIFYHDGNIDKKVSFGRLEPFFTGRTSPGGIAALNTSSVSICSAAWHRHNYWMAYPSGTSTACDRLLRVDLSHEAEGIPISIYSYSAPAEISFIDTEPIDGLLVAGGTDGYLYQLETGADDAGTGIAWYWRTKDFALSKDLDRKPLWLAQADMNSGSQDVVFTQYSDNGKHTSTLGTSTTTELDWSQIVKGETSHFARRNVSLKLAGTATAELQLNAVLIDTVEYK